MTEKVVLRASDEKEFSINPRFVFSPEEEMKNEFPKPELCSSTINNMWGGDFPKEIDINVRFDSDVVEKFVNSINSLFEMGNSLTQIPVPVSCEIEYPKKDEIVKEIFVNFREYLKRENRYYMINDFPEGTPLHCYLLYIEKDPRKFANTLLLSDYLGCKYICDMLFMAFVEWRHLEVDFETRQQSFYQKIIEQDPENGEYLVEQFRFVLNSIKNAIVYEYENDQMRVPRIERALECEPDDPEEARLEREAEAKKKLEEENVVKNEDVKSDDDE